MGKRGNHQRPNEGCVHWTGGGGVSCAGEWLRNRWALEWGSRGIRGPCQRLQRLKKQGKMQKNVEKSNVAEPLSRVTDSGAEVSKDTWEDNVF